MQLVKAMGTVEHINRERQSSSATKLMILNENQTPPEKRQLLVGQNVATRSSVAFKMQSFSRSKSQSSKIHLRYM
jgi:hypothetical protein